jgi:glutamine synthetase
LNAADVLAAVADSDVELIRLDYVDWGGLLRGRTVSRDHLANAFETGIGSAMTNMTIGVDDHESDPALGAQTGDVWYVPDPTTYVTLPWAPGYAHMFIDVVDAAGQPWFGDPRAVLRRVAAQAAAELGTVRLGFEQEGHLLRRDGDTYVKAFNTRVFLADFQDLLPGFFLDMCRALRAMGSPLEKFTIESPHGMPELNVRYDDALPSADKHARFKLAFRTVARQHGYVGSFMPKPFEDMPGAGCHIHVSVADPADESDLFAATDDARGMGLSQTAYFFLGGILAHADALCAIGSPTVNSYKRLQPGAWAPAVKGYGPGNRSAMVRIVQHRTRSDGHSAARLELRSPDGTANSYLLGAAIIACGLDGVRNAIQPGEPSGVDFGHLTDWSIAPLLPRSLDRALDAFEQDDVLRQALGERLFNGYQNIKRQEWQAFSRAVTDWEKRTYADFF